MKDTPENKVKKQIQDLLRADGWFVQSNPQFGPFVRPGRPDMEAYKAGRIILIECKSLVGKQSDAQKLYQRRVAPFAPYILARSVDDISLLLRYYCIAMPYILARSVDDIKPYLTQIQMLF